MIMLTWCFSVIKRLYLTSATKTVLLKTVVQSVQTRRKQNLFCITGAFSPSLTKPDSLRFFFFFSSLWLHNPLSVLACSIIFLHSVRSPHNLLQPLTFIYFKSSSTSSNYLLLGFSVILPPIGFQSAIFIVVLLSSIRITDPAHSNLILLMNRAMSPPCYYELIQFIIRSNPPPVSIVEFAKAQRLSQDFTLRYSKLLFTCIS